MTLEMADVLPSFRFGPVSPESMVIWADVLRDPNPIHLDRSAVAAMGLGTMLINQGPANLAYLLNAVLEAYPGAVVERFSSRFVGNVLEGDMVVVSGTVTEIEPTLGGARVTIAMVLQVEGRGHALTATVVARVPQANGPVAH